VGVPYHLTEGAAPGHPRPIPYIFQELDFNRPQSKGAGKLLLWVSLGQMYVGHGQPLSVIFACAPAIFCGFSVEYILPPIE